MQTNGLHRTVTTAWQTPFCQHQRDRNCKECGRARVGRERCRHARMGTSPTTKAISRKKSRLVSEPTLSAILACPTLAWGVDVPWLHSRPDTVKWRCWVISSGRDTTPGDTDVSSTEYPDSYRSSAKSDVGKGRLHLGRRRKSICRFNSQARYGGERSSS